MYDYVIPCQKTINVMELKTLKSMDTSWQFVGISAVFLQSVILLLNHVYMCACV